MSDNILKRKRIRLALDISTMDAPKDVISNGTPESWLGNDVQFELGVFYNKIIRDISLVASVTLLIKDTVLAEEKLIEIVVPASEFDLTCDQASWTDGTKQQILIPIPRAQMNLTLSGATKNFWLSIYALTTSAPAEEITLGAGNIIIRDDGNLTPGLVKPQDRILYSAADCDGRFVQLHGDQAWKQRRNGKDYHFIQSTGLWYPEIAQIVDGVPTLTLGPGESL